MGLGLESRWLKWFPGCVSNASFSHMVNGKHREWFTSSRGLHQREPMSSFWFTLVVDVLSRMVQKGVDSVF